MLITGGGSGRVKRLSVEGLVDFAELLLLLLIVILELLGFSQHLLIIRLGSLIIGPCLSGNFCAVLRLDARVLCLALIFQTGLLVSVALLQLSLQLLLLSSRLCGEVAGARQFVTDR